jgi:hypothetical protein
MAWYPGSLRRVTALVCIAAIGVSACGSGSSSSDVPLSAVAADVGMVPEANGFSFANFGSSASPEYFDANDLKTMFGDAACVKAVTDKCIPTAQAAAWAQMVNEARASGHCEGLAVQAAVRFDQKATPETVKLFNDGDVTHGIMRAFATQFLPEVQDATNSWAKKSLVEIINELSLQLSAGKTAYTLGLYTPSGGHAVLPYAMEFPEENLAVIKVYDSNWPGMERFVVIDLATKTWYFSFSGQNPQKDECAWTGGEGDMDITPMSARVAGTCPFCGDGSKVTKSVLLIRSTGKEWAVTTPSGTFTPSNTEQVADISSRAIRTATCDTEVKIPEFILSTDSEDFEISLPESASVYVSNGNSVIKINTNGNKKRKPITFKKNKVEVGNKDTTVTVATDNVVAQVNSDQAAFTIDENLINIDFGNSQSPVVVDEKKPQVIIENTAGAAPVVKETESLISVVPTVKPELQPEPTKPGLTAPETRDLSNPSYVAAVSLTPTTPVTAPPVTTIASTTSTTLKKTTTSSSTTTTTTAGNQQASTSPTTSTAPTSSSSTTTTTKAPTATTSTTAAPTTSTTIPTRMVTIRFSVVGSGWNPNVRMNHASSYLMQDWDNMTLICTTASTCNSGTYSMPYGDYFFFRGTSGVTGSYVQFGTSAGYSNWNSEIMTYRQCDSGYPGDTVNVCEIILHKTFPL